MKTTIKKEIEITITHIKITVPVRYGDEDIPNDFPLRQGNTWEAMINIDTGQIENWPQDPLWKDCSLTMKVCDEGTYTLYSYFGDHWDLISELRNEYVPHGVVPGSYGDYIEFNIKDGRITNWPKSPNVSRFFPA